MEEKGRAAPLCSAALPSLHLQATPLSAATPSPPPRGAHPLPPHPEALQPSRAPGDSPRLLDCTPEGRTRDCSEQPRRLKGGQEGLRDSSSSVSLTQAPPGSAAPLPVTGRC